MAVNRLNELSLGPHGDEDPMDEAVTIQQEERGRGHPQNTHNSRNQQVPPYPQVPQEQAQQVPPRVLKNEGYASAIVPPRIREKTFLITIIDEKPMVVQSIMDDKLPIIDELTLKSDGGENEDQAPSTSSQASETSLREKESIKEAIMEIPKAYNPIPRPPPLFPQRFAKQ
ncbi:hypothetical protein K7X08_010414 [Anisodus acutangulus]|uniref:Uncharacterized protein n=1 Tax=Anisodus acutangulus TaxID=402998 RepID=A0A9Q1N1M2_9SOLA|nr:hypothetical protein K7X08_010414 [Anisodus acutangulus]